MNRFGAKGNVAKIEADAKRIVKRLLSGDATISGLYRREYHVAYGTLMRMLREHMTEDQLQDIQKRNNAKGGKLTRFKKGHVPWDKGLKGIHLSPKSEFKPGCMRGAAARKYRAIGTISTRYESPPKHLRGRKRKAGMPPWRGKPIKWIKISDDGPLQNRWIPLAHYIWQQAYGPIPKGRLIVHIDGNALNNILTNLKMVDRRGHLALQMQRDPGMRLRCRKSTGATSKLRHQTNRELRKIKESKGVQYQKFWECQSCGAGVEQKDRPYQCPKCGSTCYELRKTEIRRAG